jgi:hypothetical protein
MLNNLGLGLECRFERQATIQRPRGRLKTRVAHGENIC